jgi:CDP-diacylglycerol--glycerol-3-phosphate 3-phosphatidyltransferase
LMPNLPNSISFFRVALVPVLMVFLLAGIPSGDILAFVTLGVAAFSDTLDGTLARRRREVTVMGAFLDPLADKLLVSGALISLVALDKLSAWVATVIIAREFAVSGLRMIAAVQKVVIPASRWGKAKTLSQLLAITALIIEPRWLKPEWQLLGHKVSWYLIGLALILTVASGIDYFVKARSRLRGMPPVTLEGYASLGAHEEGAGRKSGVRGADKKERV